MAFISLKHRAAFLSIFLLTFACTDLRSDDFRICGFTFPVPELTELDPNSYRLIDLATDRSIIIPKSKVISEITQIFRLDPTRLALFSESQRQDLLRQCFLAKEQELRIDDLSKLYLLVVENLDYQLTLELVEEISQRNPTIFELIDNEVSIPAKYLAPIYFEYLKTGESVENTDILELKGELEQIFNQQLDTAIANRSAKQLRNLHICAKSLDKSKSMLDALEILAGVFSGSKDDSISRLRATIEQLPPGKLRSALSDQVSLNEEQIVNRLVEAANYEAALSSLLEIDFSKRSPSTHRLLEQILPNILPNGIIAGEKAQRALGRYAREDSALSQAVGVLFKKQFNSFVLDTEFTEAFDLLNLWSQMKLKDKSSSSLHSLYVTLACEASKFGDSHKASQFLAKTPASLGALDRLKLMISGYYFPRVLVVLIPAAFLILFFSVCLF